MQKTRTCTKCHEVKPEEQFNWHIKDVRRAAQCKDCHRVYRRQHYLKNHEKYKAKAKRWIAENGGARFLQYGISDEAYEALLSRHGGKCWICRASPATAIDHDHTCCPGGKKKTCGSCVRGLLCLHCNTGLGYFKDSPELLTRAAQYLNSPMLDSSQDK